MRTRNRFVTFNASKIFTRKTEELSLNFCQEIARCKPVIILWRFNSRIFFQVMQLMSVWGPLIYAGCFAATLSTALTNLLSVPRLIQALGQDRIYPWLFYFSKGYGKSGEPYRGYVLTFGVAALFLLIGNMSISTVHQELDRKKFSSRTSITVNFLS